MLTKKERAAIVERLRSTYYITNSTLFKALTGEEELIENDQVRELCVIARVIFELCNTSNMIELPRDKDGTVKGSKGVIEALADLIDPTCNPVEAGNNIVCSECGADLYDDDLYCSRCGSRVVRRNDQA